MIFSNIIVLLALAFHAIAYGPVVGSISINGKGEAVHFGEIETQEIKLLPLESTKDVIEIKLKDSSLQGQPEQILFTLADAKKPSVATHFVPVVKGKNINLSIPASSLPDVLKIKDTLVLSLIIADGKQSTKKVNKRLLEIKPSRELKSTSKQETVPTFGLQPEIHHIFKEDEQGVNPVVPVAFILVAVALHLALLASWVGFIGVKDLFRTLNTTSSSQLLQNISFLLSLLGFEVNFVKYYLGQSIFTTLFYGTILSIPSLYFGRSVLRALAKNRALGKQ